MPSHPDRVRQNHGATVRQTHTFATLEVSAGAYAEIRAKLEAAGYQHAFVGGAIDMHGIGIQIVEPAVVQCRRRCPGAMGIGCYLAPRHEGLHEWSNTTEDGRYILRRWPD